MKYLKLQDFLTEKLEKPVVADCIELVYKDIKFNIYGVLHGITGGTNKEYIKFINKTIKESKGLKLAEKSMLKIYKGIDFEVDDWLQMRYKDSFLLSFKLMLSPLAIYSLVKTIIIEKLRTKDKFNLNNKRLEDLGGSPYFHLLDPIERRELCGFKNSYDYFKINKERRNNLYHNTIKFMDKDWKWLSYIEKYVNIPYRSIHMIESAVLIAKQKDINEVSIFVGETHNSDISWYINSGHKELEFKDEFEKIIEETKTLKNNKLLLSKKRKYILSVALGAVIPINFYLFMIKTYCN